MATLGEQRAMQAVYNLPRLYKAGAREAWVEFPKGAKTPALGYQVRGSFGPEPIHFVDEREAEDCARLWSFEGISPKQRETLRDLQPIQI